MPTLRSNRLLLANCLIFVATFRVENTSVFLCFFPNRSLLIRVLMGVLGVPGRMNASKKYCSGPPPGCRQATGGPPPGHLPRCPAGVCFKMLQNATKIVQNALKCFKMLQKCFKMLQNLLKCFKILKNASKCFKMLSNALKCLKWFRMLQRQP